MIVFIEGTLVEASPIKAIIQASGLGYEIHIPVSTAEKLPSTGDICKLHTHAVYKEDSQSLYGFATVEMRDLFRLIVDKVSGVGPKIALNLMSSLTPEQFAQAVSDNDTTTLSKCPGIGKRTAERIVIELKDKLGKELSRNVAVSLGDLASPENSTMESDAAAALCELGFKPADAEKAVQKAAKAMGSEKTVEALIRLALRR